MSGAAYLERARQASDPADADRLAALAIVVEPDLTDAYALRARLAALRGDAVVAAHYFRAAYARGDRSPPTRACLAICLAAAQQEELARRVGADHKLPPEFEGFVEAVHGQAAIIRQMLALRLPPPGEPAFLPGERPPTEESVAALRPGPSASGANPAVARTARPSGVVAAPRSHASDQGLGRRRPSGVVAAAPEGPATATGGMEPARPSGALPAGSLPPPPSRPSPPRATGGQTSTSPRPSGVIPAPTSRPSGTLPAPGARPSGMIPTPASRPSGLMTTPTARPSGGVAPAPARASGLLPAPESRGSQPSSPRASGVIPAATTRSSSGVIAPPSRASGFVATPAARPSGIALPRATGEGIPAVPAHPSSSVEVPGVAPPPARASSGQIVRPDPADLARQSTGALGRVAAPPSRVSGPRVIRHGSVPLPDWLDDDSIELGGGPQGAEPDWLEQTAPPDATPASGRWSPGGLELADDPGMPEAVMRSPVTGLAIGAEDIARQRHGATMPEIIRGDALEARAVLLDAVADPGDLRIAVRLPGPVVTGPGVRPRKLCDRCALGLTQDEVLLRDADDPTAAVARLPAAQLRRLEVIDDGQQLSIHLIDGRQVHLDLRTLRARAPFIASAVTDGIAEALEVPS